MKLWWYGWYSLNSLMFIITKSIGKAVQTYIYSWMNNWVLADYIYVATVCLVDGWGNWSECSVTCGNGTQFRTRECDGDCKNKSIEVRYKDCDLGCCPGNCKVFALIMDESVMLFFVPFFFLAILFILNLVTYYAQCVFCSEFQYFARNLAV